MRRGDSYYQGQMLVETIIPKLKMGHNDGSKYEAILNLFGYLTLLCAGCTAIKVQIII
jgi:hypothetical protein